MNHCVFCDSAEVARVLSAREMMFGLKDQFDYNECGNCHSYYIRELPADLGRYYPSKYYSFAPRTVLPLKEKLRVARLHYAVRKTGFVGSFLCALFGNPPIARWLSHLNIPATARIVDVGCGSGSLITDLRETGYSDLIGIDPYIEKDVTLDGVQLRKLALRDFPGEADVFMFHHSLEHMENPRQVFAFCHSRLRPNGRLLVRVPVAGSWAAQEYGEHWVQLDAPRHLAIPSVEGLKSLARKTGFVLDTMFFDSHALQFYGSEIYRRGIPLQNGNPKELFTRREMREFRRRSAELNSKGLGDAGCFIFAKDATPVFQSGS